MTYLDVSPCLAVEDRIHGIPGHIENFAQFTDAGTVRAQLAYQPYIAFVKFCAVVVASARILDQSVAISVCCVLCLCSQKQMIRIPARFIVALVQYVHTFRYVAFVHEPRNAVQASLFSLVCPVSVSVRGSSGLVVLPTSRFRYGGARSKAKYRGFNGTESGFTFRTTQFASVCPSVLPESNRKTIFRKFTAALSANLGVFHGTNSLPGDTVSVR